MLYLVSGFDYPNGFNNPSVRLLKIGFTDHRERRETSYITHGSLAGFMDTRDGDEEMEALFHFYFRKYKYQKLSEWFTWEQEIIDKFPTLTLTDLYQEQFNGRDEFVFTSITPRADFIKRNSNYYKGISPKDLSLNQLDQLILKRYSHIWTTSYSGIPQLDKAANVINGPGDFRDKMKLFCETVEGNPLEWVQTLSDMVPPKYFTYYDYFGSQKLRAIGYQESLMKHDLQNKYALGSADLKNDIVNSFVVGKRYTRKEVKTILGAIYKKHKMTITPKASHLEKYFEIKNALLSIGGRRENGFEIISIR